jgi:hypothetical protein
MTPSRIPGILASVDRRRISGTGPGESNHPFTERGSRKGSVAELHKDSPLKSSRSIAHSNTLLQYVPDETNLDGDNEGRLVRDQAGRRTAVAE